MAKQVNNMMIGGFVVTAVFLLAASLVVFGSGRFFKQTDRFVLHFEGTIKGLNVGSPVLLQGVQIGSVKSIVLRTSRQELAMDIPVVIEIEPDRFYVVDSELNRRDPTETLAILIDRGLRGVLSMQSFITGQLMIELDFYPGTPVNLREKASEYPEIPTIPSTTERLYQVLQDIDFKGLAGNLEHTLSGIDSFVNSPDWAAGIKSLRLTADELRGLIGQISAKVETLGDSVDLAIGDARNLINSAETTFQATADDARGAIGGIDKLSRDAGTSLTQLTGELETTMAGFRTVLSTDAPLIITLEKTLGDIAIMARSLRQLADYLEQHPEALIQGKGNN